MKDRLNGKNGKTAGETEKKSLNSSTTRNTTLALSFHSATVKTDYNETDFKQA